MDGWQFVKEDELSCVDLPHTWNNIDGQDGGNDYYRGTCIYKKKLGAIEYDESTQEVYLEFLGVNASAFVVFNGKELCEHHNGYSTFRVNVTPYLDEENELVVKVDNSVNDKVYPQRADFTFYGGIYRDVKILIVPKDRFDLDFYGSKGVQITSKVFEDTLQEKESSDNALGVLRRANVNVEVKTYFTISSEEKFSVKLKVFDEDEKLVYEADKGVNSNAKAKLTFDIKDAILWDGIDNPYRYKFVTTLVKGEEVVDEVVEYTGFRFFSVDPSRGFFLNGRSFPLKGVSRHQDRKGIGNAITYEMMEEDMDLIREMGTNSIRLAHYQHNQYFYDLCDKYGMIVWAEIPYISMHMKSGNDNTHFQMKELVVQNYNHPSIVMWGISNEITISWKNSFGDCIKNHKKLQKLIKKLDPTRLTTMACFSMCTPFHPITYISDIIAWNNYYGWYFPGLFMNDLFMYWYRIFHPKKPLGYSEYGAEGMPNLHSIRPRRGDQTEDYQAIYHEYMIKCFERHKFIWGSYVWNMFDFAADARDQGGEPGMNHKGLVTFDRKVKKDSFYAYKAAWSEEKFVHICGKKFEARPGKKLKIKVYSNLPVVTIYQNGEELETQCGERTFTFALDSKPENKIKVIARDKDGNEFVDETVIVKTDKLLDKYKTPKGNAMNWV